MKRITYYHILGVSSDATDDEIVAAFRSRVKQWHPDVCNHPDAEERMREINRAAEVLCDPERRKRYDRALARSLCSEDELTQRASPVTGSHDKTAWFFTRTSWTLPLFHLKVRSDTYRFFLAGFAAVAILVSLIALAFTAFPLFPAPAPVSSPVANHETMVPGQVSQVTEEKTGDSLLASGHYKEALSAYNEVIADTTMSPDRNLWYNRGVALRELGMYSEAAESFNQALRIQSGYPLPLAHKISSLTDLAGYPDSFANTENALTCYTESGMAGDIRNIAPEFPDYTNDTGVSCERGGFPSGLAEDGLYHDVVINTGSPTLF